MIRKIALVLTASLLGCLTVQPAHSARLYGGVRGGYIKAYRGEAAGSILLGVSETDDGNGALAFELDVTNSFSRRLHTTIGSGCLVFRTHHRVFVTGRVGYQVRWSGEHRTVNESSPVFGGGLGIRMGNHAATSVQISSLQNDEVYINLTFEGWL